MNSPELVFLHIPKTAGTSQRSTFWKHYGTENVFWIGVDCPTSVVRYPGDQVGNRFVIGGHRRLSFYPRDLDPLYCSILRDPIERAVSLFGFYTRPDLAVSEAGKSARSKLLQRKLSQGIDPESMLLSIRNSSKFRGEISNVQCRFLSLGARTFADVRHSLKHLDHVIGTMSNHDRFHRELGELLGWPETRPGVFNRSQNNYLAPYLQDEELVAKLRELNLEDQKLLDYVEGEQRGLWTNLVDAKQRRRRLRSLPLAPSRKEMRKRRMDKAAELRPPRGEAKLGWLLGRMMVVLSQKLAYMPTSGTADPVIKRMMLQLSSVPHKGGMQLPDVDSVMARNESGLVLDDLSQEEIRSIAESQDYFRFAILYHPVARLVEIFEQRFVWMRADLRAGSQLYQLVADAQEKVEPDCDLGISFRQFVRACISGRYNHPLLLTQSRHLPWPDSYDRFYLPSQLPLLASDLRELRGISVDLPEIAHVPPTALQAAEASYADIPAGQLPEDAGQWRARLLDKPLLEMIEDFYAKDFTLYNRAVDETQGLEAQ